MPKITILGAGITGLTIASQLPVDHDVTIIGEHLPGDPPSKEWASPWAAATWVGVHDSNARDQAMQLEAYYALVSLARSNPESTARLTEMTEIMDTGSPSQVWYQHKVNNFRFLGPDELARWPKAKYGMKYQTVVLTPHRFIEWLRARLESRGIRFLRAHVTSLGDLAGLGHDVLVNASGFGPVTLTDVQDNGVKPVQLQSLIIKHPTYNGCFIHRGENYYSTAFARSGGYIYVGGGIQYGSDDLTASDSLRDTLIERLHENQPEFFPSPKLADYQYMDDWIGKYPARLRKNGGNRVEQEVLNGQKVVHAYGQHAGGYVNSYGMARAAVALVVDFLNKVPGKL